MKILSSIEDASEEDLLAVIDLRREDRSSEETREFNEALETLLGRHQGYIFATIHNVLKGIPGIVPEDIYWTVVHRLIELAGKFSADSNDPERVRKQFLGWIGQVAAIVTRESMRELGTERVADAEAMGKLLKAVEVKAAPDTKLVSQVRQIMDDELTENEREVLRAWVLVCPLDGRQGRMDSEDLEILCKTLDTSKQNFRKLKSRALAKLKAELEPLITA